jgi:pimeloyl-ACP methyl ester carboxylesterase
VRIEQVAVATETVPLDGLWFTPEQVAARCAALLMHGNQGNFYVGPPRFLPPALARIGVASLAYNRRGHDILATYRGRQPVGGALQLTSEAVADNGHAARFVAERGFPSPVVIGHSNGGLLAARHVAENPGTPALVLLSAAGGGLDATRRESAQGILLADRYDELVAAARRKAEAGEADELMLLPAWWWVISPASLLDRLDTLPDLVALAPSIRCPTLFLKGAAEPEVAYPARAFAAACPGPCEVVELQGCDHWYNGRDDEVAGIVASWLESVLPDRSASSGRREALVDEPWRASARRDDGQQQ